MPYTPPAAIPSVPVPGNMGATGGAGTFTTFDYSNHINALILEINKLNYTFSSVGGLEPGSPLAVQKALQVNINSTSSTLDDISRMLRELNLNISDMNKTMEMSVEALAAITYQLAKSNTTAQLVAADQIKNNQFQQQTTNKALVDAGKEPTEVKQEQVTAAIKSSVTDISAIKLQVGAASVVETAVTDSVTAAATIAQGWALKTSFGQWVGKKYADTKASIKALYPAQEAKDKLNIAERAKATTLAGNPPKAGDVKSD